MEEVFDETLLRVQDRK